MAELAIEDLKKMRDDGKDYWSEIHRNHKSYTAISYGTEDSQWDPTVLQNRRSSNRPCQQYNIVPGFIRPTVNALKECPPEIAIYPISDATKEAATLLGGRVRAIQYENNAARAYLAAMESAMRGGLGAWRITPRKIRGEIRLCLDLIQDPTTVYVDPTAQAVDRSDAKWVVIENQIADADYRRQWPKGEATGFDGKITIWEAWVEVSETRTGEDGIEETIIRVCHYIFDDREKLAYTDRYLGSIIPVIVVTAPAVIIDDKLQIFPITHDLIAMQREINWLKSEAIAQVSSWPKAQFMASDKAVGPYQVMWEQSATAPDALLLYVDGHEKPQPIMPPPPPTGYMELTDASTNMARQVTGIYPDPTLQQAASAPSGKAIKLQRMGSGVANYHYVDAINYALKRTGEILVELIIKYQNDNAIRIALGSDQQPTAVSFGDQDVPDAANHDLSRGRFGVTISTGPSYASQREELLDKVSDLLQKDPQLLPIVADWLLMQMPIPGVEEVAERIRLTLPPAIQELISSKKTGDPSEQLSQARLILQQKDKLVGDLKQHLEAVTKTLLAERQEMEAKVTESASRERLEEIRQRGETEREEMRIRAGHIKTDVVGERDERLEVMRTESAKQIAALKTESDRSIAELRAQVELLLAARENASDAALAQRQGSEVEVIA